MRNYTHNSDNNYRYQRTTYYSPQRPQARKLMVGRKRPSVRLVAFILIIIIGIVGFNANNSHNSHAHGPNLALAAVKTYAHIQTVCLDPGHGGVDPGAVTTDGTITERDINLQVANTAQQLLESAGYKVYMTRTDNNTSMTNHDRYTYCNDQKASIMVSIHHNFFTDSSVDYSTALFYKDQDQALATSVLNAVVSSLGTTNDGIASFDDGVLSESTMPATVSEGFFITSDAEDSDLTGGNATRLDVEAKGIAQGIENYFTQPHDTSPTINAHPQVLERDDNQ